MYILWMQEKHLEGGEYNTILNFKQCNKGAGGYYTAYVFRCKNTSQNII